jgi:hypothetical protein
MDYVLVDSTMESHNNMKILYVPRAETYIKTWKKGVSSVSLVGCAKLDHAHICQVCLLCDRQRLLQFIGRMHSSLPIFFF